MGSTLKFALNGVSVWGTGIMAADHYVNPKASYHAVRGPITRNKVIAAGGKCPKVYGDPALLLPMFYRPTVEKKYQHGIIPHYVDYEAVKLQMQGTGVKVLNIIGSDIHAFIDSMLECEKIVSSSLHGVITAHAYGLDAVWVKFSDKLNGDGSKFNDYAQSVGIEMPWADLRTGVTRQKAEALNYVAPGKFEAMKLLSAFPYPVKPEWAGRCTQTFVY